MYLGLTQNLALFKGHINIHVVIFVDMHNVSDFWLYIKKIQKQTFFSNFFLVLLIQFISFRSVFLVMILFSLKHLSRDFGFKRLF